MTKYYSVLQFNQKGIIGGSGRLHYAFDDALNIYCSNLKVKNDIELREIVLKEGFDYVRVNTTWGGIITENKHCACAICRRIGLNLKIAKNFYCSDCAHKALARHLGITFIPWS